MEVLIKPKVYAAMKEFYIASIRLHETLDEATCMKKMQRLEDAMLRFSHYAEIFHKRPFRYDWNANGWYDFCTEDFHFAYTVNILPDARKVLVYHDAVHSLLNHN